MMDCTLLIFFIIALVSAGHKESGEYQKNDRFDREENDDSSSSFLSNIPDDIQFDLLIAMMKSQNAVDWEREYRKLETISQVNPRLTEQMLKRFTQDRRVSQILKKCSEQMENEPEQKRTKEEYIEQFLKSSKKESASTKKKITLLLYSIARETEGFKQMLECQLEKNSDCSESVSPHTTTSTKKIPRTTTKLGHSSTAVRTTTKISRRTTPSQTPTSMTKESATQGTTTNEPIGSTQSAEPGSSVTTTGPTTTSVIDNNRTTVGGIIRTSTVLAQSSTSSSTPTQSIKTTTIPVETIPVETTTIPVETTEIPVQTTTIPIETSTILTSSSSLVTLTSDVTTMTTPASTTSVRSSSITTGSDVLSIEPTTAGHETIVPTTQADVITKTIPFSTNTTPGITSQPLPANSRINRSSTKPLSGILQLIEILSTTTVPAVILSTDSRASSSVTSSTQSTIQNTTASNPSSVLTFEKKSSVSSFGNWRTSTVVDTINNTNLPSQITTSAQIQPYPIATSTEKPDVSSTSTNSVVIQKSPNLTTPFPTASDANPALKSDSPRNSQQTSTSFLKTMTGNVFQSNSTLTTTETPTSTRPLQSLSSSDSSVSHGPYDGSLSSTGAMFTSAASSDSTSISSTLHSTRTTSQLLSILTGSSITNVGGSITTIEPNGPPKSTTVIAKQQPKITKVPTSSEEVRELRQLLTIIIGRLENMTRVSR